MAEEQDSHDNTPFNYALRFFMDLSDLMNEIDRAYLSDEVGTYYKTLDRVYNRLCFKLDEDDKDKQFFEDEFKKAKEMLYDEDKRKEIKEIINILRNIDRKIIKLMDKYHMIFPQMNQKYGFDKVTSRYHLGEKNGTKWNNIINETNTIY